MYVFKDLFVLIKDSRGKQTGCTGERAVNAYFIFIVAMSSGVTTDNARYRDAGRRDLRSSLRFVDIGVARGLKFRPD